MGQTIRSPATPPSLVLRETPLRVLAVLPFYDPLATSGDAEYVQRVVAGLAARGVSLRVLTSCDMATRPEGAETNVWANALVRVRPPEAPVEVRRFEAGNVPGWLRGWATRLVQGARAKRVRTRGLGLGYSYLDSGFHEIERWASGFPFRWTGPIAHFQIDRPGGRDVVVELYSPGIATIDVFTNGRRKASIGLKSASWQRVELPLPASGVASFELHVRPTFIPRGDPRRLGVAVRTVTVRTRTGDELPVPLDRERDSLMQPLDTFRIAEQHEADGQEWGLLPAAWDMLLKGPVSLRFAWAAVRAARDSDLVLVAGTPYLSGVYGWLAARLAGKPLVAMPFFHLREADHHRPWNRFVLTRARHVVCESDAMFRFVEKRWGGRALVLPGGVDPAELDDPAIDGTRFRGKHGLGDGPLALMAAPKNQSSAYRSFCAAAEALQREGLAWQFVLAGPDEDGLPLPGTAVRYVGNTRPEELRDALDACDVFVRPSPSETSAVPFLQAWMRRKPVVGHAASEQVREVVSHGDDGFLVKNDDELVTTLRQLLGDADLRARLGARGRARVEERFTWDHVATQVEDLLHGIGVGAS